MTSIEGTVLEIVFCNDENGRTVMEIDFGGEASLLQSPLATAPSSEGAKEYGHFGRPDLDLSWERLDYADRLA